MLEKLVNSSPIEFFRLGVSCMQEKLIMTTDRLEKERKWEEERRIAWDKKYTTALIKVYKATKKEMMLRMHALNSFKKR